MGINAKTLPPQLRRRIPDQKQARMPALPAEVVKALSRGHRKYRNTPTIVNGLRFDSLKEAGRYKELAALARAGTIADLRVHTRWRLVVNDLEVAVYESDFDYRPVLPARPDRPSAPGDLVVEDVKSEATKTKVYQVKRKLMLACRGITIQEI